MIRSVIVTVTVKDFSVPMKGTICKHLLELDCIKCITEKYRPEQGLEALASRLTYERSTTELSISIQFCYLNLGFILNTLVSYRVCGVPP